MTRITQSPNFPFSIYLANLSAMTLTINGEEKSFATPLRLADLVQQLGMKPDRVAVELNREIVSRSEWPATQLKEGDRLEIVHFVGGGCAPGGTRFALAR